MWEEEAGKTGRGCGVLLSRREDYSGTATASVGTPVLQSLPAIVIVASGEMETLPWPAPTISPANMYSTCNHTLSPWDSKDAIFQPNTLLHFHDNLTVILLLVIFKEIIISDL